MCCKGERALVTSSWLMLTNIKTFAKGYHWWILTWCEVYLTKWRRHLCETSHPQVLWIISVMIQGWIVWLVLSCTAVFHLILSLQIKHFAHEDPAQILLCTWIFTELDVLNEPSQLAASVCRIIFLIPASPVTWTLYVAMIAGFSAWGHTALGVRERQTLSLCSANDV